MIKQKESVTDFIMNGSGMFVIATIETISTDILWMDPIAFPILTKKLHV